MTNNETTVISFLTPVMAQIQKQIAESNYEGWVAWVDGVPIYEKAVLNPGLAPVAPGQFILPRRGEGRNVMDWKDLPHYKIDMFDLYFARENKDWPQPVVCIPRLPGTEMAYIMMKIGGMVLHTRSGATRGQERLGTAAGYKVGVWIPSANECTMHEITRTQITDLGTKTSPFAPRPLGFGMGPGTIHRAF